MTLIELNKTMNELGRFVLAVQTLQQKAKTSVNGEGIEKFDPSTYTGAVKRASMDLSKALVQLRNNK